MAPLLESKATLGMRTKPQRRLSVAVMRNWGGSLAPSVTRSHTQARASKLAQCALSSEQPSGSHAAVPLPGPMLGVSLAFLRVSVTFDSSRLTRHRA